MLNQFQEVMGLAAGVGKVIGQAAEALFAVKETSDPRRPGRQWYE